MAATVQTKYSKRNRSHPGADFELVFGRKRSMFGISFSRTIRYTMETHHSSPQLPNEKNVGAPTGTIVEERQKGELDISEVQGSITSHTPG